MNSKGHFQKWLFSYWAKEYNNFAANYIDYGRDMVMLCDQLTIIKLKEYHTEDLQQLQVLQLQNEIDEYIGQAVSGQIPVERLIFASNKVFKKEGNEVSEVSGKIGAVFYQLAEISCRLWHDQEKVYEFEKVESEEKDKVVKRQALLNLERNKCIDSINAKFCRACKIQ